jgi:hypothetical protein
LGVDAFDKCGAFGGFGYVGSLAEYGTGWSQFRNRRFRLVYAAPNNDRRAPVLENDLGNRFAYSTSSSDNDQFLSLKFGSH